MQGASTRFRSGGVVPIRGQERTSLTRPFLPEAAPAEFPSGGDVAEPIVGMPPFHGPLWKWFAGTGEKHAVGKGRLMKRKAVVILLGAGICASVVQTPLFGGASFDLELTAARMPLETKMQDLLFLGAPNGSTSAPSNGGWRDVNCGTLYRTSAWWIEGLWGWEWPTTAAWNLGVSFPGTPVAGSASFSTTGKTTVFAYTSYNYRYELSGFPPSSATVTFSGGSCTMSNVQLSPSSTILYSTGHISQTFAIRGYYTFDLRDPDVRITTPSQRINTVSPGGATQSVALTISNTVNAIVQSISLDYGDGASSSVPFSQASSLTFAATASHGFALDPSQDWRTFNVIATAYGPPDNSPDDDQDTHSANVTLLRSPSAALSLNDTLVVSGSVVDVISGQVLSFDGSPALGFIEDASLILGAQEVLIATSASGLADEGFVGGLIVPELPVGSHIPLVYTTSNTGTGLNSGVWSATLHVVPEPATVSLLGFCWVGLICATARHQRKTQT